MATAEEIQIFRNLVEKWISDERAKRLIRQAKWRKIVNEPTWLAQKALQRAETFWEEVKQVSDWPVEQVTKVERIEDKPIEEFEAPPTRIERIGTWIKEAFVWEDWEETLIESWLERIREAPEWDKLTEIPKVLEWGLQLFWWLITSTLDALWTTVWEITIQPWLEALDPATLQKVWNIAWKPQEVISNVLENEWVQEVLWLIKAWVQKIPENLRKDAEALAAIFPTKKILDRFPEIKWKVPFTKEWKLAKVETKRLKDKTIKDNVSTLIWTTAAKIEDRDLLDFWTLARNNRSQLKWTKDFDQLSTVIWNIGIRDINLLNNKLKWVKKTFRPKWASEALQEMKQNLDKINFKTSDKAEINKLIKKFDKEWLTLTELNNIKKSINKYTKWWSKSWLEWAWLRAESARDKYSEVMKFIENTADREWITNIKELNRNWAVSDKFSWLLQQQARKAWVKGVKEQITKPSLIWRAIRKWREWISAPFTKAEPIDTSIVAIEKNLDKLIDNITK